MTIDIEQHSGFCFGVVSAIETAENELKKCKTLYCLGDIVHNSEEVNRLNSLGLKVISHEEFARLKNSKVLIRAHGEPPLTYQIARENNTQIIDATCPIVLKLQQKIKKGFGEMQEKKGQLLIYGKNGHAEVIGLHGQTQNQAIVISKKSDLDSLRFDIPTRLYSQTTMNQEDYMEIVKEIDARCRQEGGSFEYVDSICASMKQRAEQIRLFSKNHDAILFVSGKKSSNGQYLYSISKENNPHVFLIAQFSELKKEMFFNADGQPLFRSLGICGATSTPMWLMQQMSDQIYQWQSAK